MDFLLNLMTVVLALDCLFLILLILIQLPKKDAGAGTAFGGGTTDALFGAGTGNALTNLTKYATGVFFVLSLVLSIANASKSNMERKGRFNKVIAPTASATNTANRAANPVIVPDMTKASGSNMLSVTASNAVATNKNIAAEVVEAAKTATNAAVKAVVNAVATNQPAKAK